MVLFGRRLGRGADRGRGGRAAGFFRDISEALSLTLTSEADSRDRLEGVEGATQRLHCLHQWLATLGVAVRIAIGLPLRSSTATTGLDHLFYSIHVNAYLLD